MRKEEAEVGTVYLIPFSAGAYIVAQVGKGGDIGVFDLLSSGIAPLSVSSARILFRVDYWRGSPTNGGWVDSGVLQLHPKLSEFARYGHHSVGVTVCYAVTHEPFEEEISREEYDTLEPLATWSHEHIVQRFQEETKSGARV